MVGSYGYTAKTLLKKGGGCKKEKNDEAHFKSDTFKNE